MTAAHVAVESPAARLDRLITELRDPDYRKPGRHTPWHLDVVRPLSEAFHSAPVRYLLGMEQVNA